MLRGRIGRAQMQVPWGIRSGEEAPGTAACRSSASRRGCWECDGVGDKIVRNRTEMSQVDRGGRGTRGCTQSRRCACGDPVRMLKLVEWSVYQQPALKTDLIRVSA